MNSRTIDLNHLSDEELELRQNTDPVSEPMDAVFTRNENKGIVSSADI